MVPCKNVGKSVKDDSRENLSVSERTSH